MIIIKFESESLFKEVLDHIKNEKQSKGTFTNLGIIKVNLEKNYIETELSLGEIIWKFSQYFSQNVRHTIQFGHLAFVNRNNKSNKDTKGIWYNALIKHYE